MDYYANPSTPRVREAMTNGLLNVIKTPKQGNKHVDGVTWCADNGCFGKGYPGDDAWWAWLQAEAVNADTCAFAVAPDVVGDAAATLTRSAPWLPKIRSLGYPAALVAQNGMEHSTWDCWDEIDVLFLGGSLECLPCRWVWPADRRPKLRQPCPQCGRCMTEWKLGRAARMLVAEAKARGRHVHMGRVNSLKRLQYAEAIGCDSADGTCIARGPDVNLPKMLTNLHLVNSSPGLFGGAA